MAVPFLPPRSPGVSPITTDKQLTALNLFYLVLPMKLGIFLIVRCQAKYSSIFYSESTTTQIDGQFLTASPSIPIRAKERKKRMADRFPSAQVLSLFPMPPALMYCSSTA